MTLVLGLWLPLTGCGGDSELPSIDCPATVPSYSQVSFNVCVGCHATTRTGAQRLSAPVGVDFDTYQAARQKAEAAVREVYAGRMPPPAGGGGSLTEMQKQTLYQWGLCGTPQ